jgi:nitroreductase
MSSPPTVPPAQRSEAHPAPTDDPAEVAARLRLPLVEALETQRAIRRLSPAPVADGVVLRLLELALRAPSGANRQPQRFVVVRDRARKDQLARLNRLGWGVLRRRYGRHATTRAQQRLLAAVDWQAAHLAEAPLLVIVCSARPIAPWPPFVASSRFGSVYPSVQNLLLAARAVGLGATLTTLPVWSTRRVRRILDLPRRVQPVCAVPLGWPLGRYGATSRRPVGDVVHLDRYGNRPYRTEKGAP